MALLRAGGRAWTRYVIAVREAGGRSVPPVAVLERELGLLSYEALARAEQELAQWQTKGYSVLSTASAGYPENLRVIENRPPLLFVAGRLERADRRSVAVIGTRDPSEEGRACARDVAVSLASSGFVVASGLAAGIDAESHRAVLAQSALAPSSVPIVPAAPTPSGASPAASSRHPARTIAVIGTGLDHVYPPHHAALQREIAEHGAVISQFWPEAEPTRRSFPARNAVMSGMTLGSVIVEASEHSGTRVQARHALAQARVVVLMPLALRSSWARDLAERPGVLVAEDGAAVVDIFRRCAAA